MKPMQRDEAIHFINNERTEATGGDVFRQIDTFSTVCTSESDDRSFVQFNLFCDSNGNRQRVIRMFDPTYNVYIPVLHMLVDAKDKLIYWHALHTGRDGDVARQHHERLRGYPHQERA